MRKLLLCLLLLTLPCFAQDGWKVELQLVRFPDFRGKLDYLMELSQWQSQLKAGEVLETGFTPMTLDKESAFFLGRKFPITYSDARAGMTQVQYVDIGFKGSFHPKVLGDGRVQMDCVIEKRALGDEKLPLPTVDNFSCQSVLLLKPGQVAIASVSRGLIGIRYLKGIYNRTFSEKDTFVWAVTARKL